MPITREQMNLDLPHIWQAARKTILLSTHSTGQAAAIAVLPLRE
jgi:ABC-type nitrate/sulfonate/bicarbonate transport system ATPase subunit